MTFDEFETTASELFGLEAGEVRDFADVLDAAGLPFEGFDVDDRQYWEIASDLTDEFYEDIEVAERYPLDRYFPDDDYLDPGDLWEFTAEAYVET